MTREELKEKFSKDITRIHSYGFNGEEIRELVGTEFDIDGIIDYIEALQSKIKELEEQLKQAHTDGYNDCYKKLNKQKICDGCKK